MTDASNIETIMPEVLRQWQAEEKPLILIHTLPSEHFQSAHLPGSRNACVYEVTFLDQVKAITEDKAASIVVYGSSKRSRDAWMAADKLLRADYRQVRILEGGIEAWRSAGYPLEGDAPDLTGETGGLLALEDGDYQIDTELSIVEWAGRNPNTRHHGTVRIAEGRIRIAGGVIRGSATIDMSTIENLSLKGDELQPVLESHLKSDDFFFVKFFPTATFTIREGTPVEPPYLSAPNYRISGTLNMRGITEALAFPATINPTDDGGITAEAHFDIDRTLWDVIYGSTRFFEHLGMHLVFDPISLQMKVIAR